MTHCVFCEVEPVFCVVFATALISFAIYVFLRVTISFSTVSGGQRSSPPEAVLVTSNNRFNSSSVSCKRSNRTQLAKYLSEREIKHKLYALHPSPVNLAAFEIAEQTGRWPEHLVRWNACVDEFHA